MPIIKKSDGKKYLRVFENPKIDYSLPKYKKKYSNTSDNESSISVSSNSGQWTLSQNNTMFQTKPSALSLLFEWIMFKVKKVFYRNPSKPFRMVFKNMEHLQKVHSKIEHINILISKARENGQDALVESLNMNLDIKIYEDQLLLLGLDKAVTESQLVKFISGYEKELSLSYINNYTRIIPDDVTEKKREVDKHCIFDNWVILHYDPNHVGHRLTKKEKDPILFGFISGSRKLYYVADWKDAVCDLTLEDILKKFSEDEITMKENIVVSPKKEANHEIQN